eukprot:5066705-Amphidinium_carterae.1
MQPRVLEARLPASRMPICSTNNAATNNPTVNNAISFDIARAFDIVRHLGVTFGPRRIGCMAASIGIESDLAALLCNNMLQA